MTNPNIKTLLEDHSCPKPDAAYASPPVTNPLVSSVPEVGGFSSLDDHTVSQKRDLNFDGLIGIIPEEYYFGFICSFD